MAVNYFEALLNEERNKVNIINYYSLWINLQKQFRNWVIPGRFI